MCKRSVILLMSHRHKVLDINLHLNLFSHSCLILYDISTSLISHLDLGHPLGRFLSISYSKPFWHRFFIQFFKHSYTISFSSVLYRRDNAFATVYTEKVRKQQSSVRITRFFFILSIVRYSKNLRPETDPVFETLCSLVF
jgi:hypothetical protein